MSDDGRPADVAAFLAARLGEDEAAANAATDEPGALPSPWHPAHFAFIGFSGPLPAAEAHIARHDPARVLREVTAKRKIMTEIAPWLDADEDEDWYNRGVGKQPPYTGSPFLLKILAAVYSDHPGYRAEWKP